jgi:ATP-dependent protease ClpP protease subunit
MIKLSINGVIGFFGISNEFVEEELKAAAAGEEIQVEINSPGGSAFECIAIFNTIRNYAKSHSVSTVINGIAASAASVIAIAARTVDPEAKVEASENSIYFIHNPIDYTEGDYREMQKKADYLQRLVAMFAAIYSGVSGQDIKKIRAAMDAETYYIGKEIQDAGFANTLQIINQSAADNSDAKAALIASAEMTIATARKKMEAEKKADSLDDLEKAAALLETAMRGDAPNNSGGSLPAEINNQKPGDKPPAGGKGGEMNPDELLAQYPECYKAVFALGQNAERERVTAHLKLAEKSHSYETAAKFITDGASVMSEAVQSEYLALAMNAQHTAARIKDNPGDVHTGDDTVDESKAYAAFDAGYSGKESGGQKWTK